MQLAAFVLMIATGALAALGVGYCVLVLAASVSFSRAARQARRGMEPFAPPVSILKAVKGVDPGLVEALRTHCTQQYAGEVELLLGVYAPDDPSLPLLEALRAEFPAMRIEVLTTPLVLGANGKVSSLAQLAPHARFEHLLIADADIAVGRRYLSAITAPFADPKTGLVTAGYSGRTSPARRPTLGSRLEALSISTDFFPGVLAARLTERGVRFGLGSTLLVARRALSEMGGLEALTDVLADDHEMGRRIAQAGFRVVLSPEPVTTAVPAYTLAGFWQHQLRWARTVRAARPWGYAGLIFTHPAPWALLFVLATAGNPVSLVLLLLAVLARMAVAIRVGFGQLRDAQVLRDLVLLPLRDCFGLALWAWSYAGDTVVWRGERFRVRGGSLVRLDG